MNRIKQDVRVCVDQNRNTDALFEAADIDSLTLDEVIESKVLEAVERVHKSAPYDLLELGHNFGTTGLFWGDMESGWVVLPSDFMRLVVFQMSDWERPVYSAISATDPEYKRQRSRIKGLRGNAQRPVCAIGMRPEGKVLEFYSCKDVNAQVMTAVYMPFPKIVNNNCVDISERCYDAVIYTAAGLALISCGETDKAKVLLETANSLLGNGRQS